MFDKLIKLVDVADALSEAARFSLETNRTKDWTTPVDAKGPYTFPKDFLWGSAVAAQHVEDQQPSDWTAFELDVIAKGKTKTGKLPGQGEPGHINNHAGYSEIVRTKKTDFDTVYDQDFQTAKSFNHNAFRFSISWSRLFPRENMQKADEAGIAYYRGVLDSCKKHGLTPTVSLFHFESPQWFWKEKDGQRGWERDDAVEHFSLFVEAVVEAFGGDITIWCTHNEPMVFIFNGYLEGLFPPLEQRNGPADIADVMESLLKCHAAAHKIIKADAIKRGIDAQVGVTMHTRAFQPYRNWNPLDRVLAGIYDQAFIWDFLDAMQTGTLNMTGQNISRFIPGLAGTMDFVGINYYGRYLIESHALKPMEPTVHFNDPAIDDDLVNDLGWECYPHGFYQILTKAHKRYGLPIYILENGTCDGEDEDRRRQTFMVSHIKEMWNAMTVEGADIRGYFHWTMMDNFEWAEGFEARFGLMKVDYENGFKRIPRPSATLYADIIKADGISEEIWQRYKKR